MILWACGGSKRLDSHTQATKPKKSQEKRTTRTSLAVDTIYWTEIDRTKEYNQTIEDLELDKRSSYKVGLLFPFALEKNKPEDVFNPASRLGRMTRFYLGTRMALDLLNKEGVSLEVITLDSESGNFDSKLRLYNDFDVIIGPREKGQLSTTAQYGFNNGIPVISPWLSSTKVARNNPYYIQLKPSLRKHMAKLVDDVKQNYKDDQVFVLGRKSKKDIGMMRYIQELATVNRPGLSSGRFKEYYIEEDSLISGDTAFDEIFFEDRETVFILPNWSFSDDEQFVYNVVRKLSGEKGLNNVSFYGMPILLESDRVKFEHYSNLNMRIARTSYLDREDTLVKEFRQEYHRLYKDFPSEEVFKGFDMMMFIGRSINNYGKKFQYFLDTYESSLYQTEYNVTKVFPKSSDDFKDIQYFQNDHIYILEFKDNHFQVH